MPTFNPYGGQGLVADPNRAAREIAEEQGRVDLANALQQQAQQNQMRQAEMNRGLAIRQMEADRAAQTQAMEFQAQQAELDRANQPFNLQEALFQDYKRGSRTPETLQGLGLLTQQAQPQADITSQADQARALGLEPTKQVGGKVTFEQKKAESMGRDSKQFDQAVKLQDKFNNQSKDFFKVRDSYERIKASASDPSAAGDLALIFNYMKVLDPGSVVRESEFANAQNAAGVPDKIRAQYNQVLNGERLAPNTRADFVGRAGKLFQSQANIQQRNVDRYSQIAERWSLDPADVVMQISQQEVVATPQGEEVQQQEVTVEWLD